MHIAVDEVKDPSKMAPTSLAHTYTVFHNLYMLWVCTWMSHYNVNASIVDQAVGVA